MANSAAFLNACSVANMAVVWRRFAHWFAGDTEQFVATQRTVHLSLLLHTRLLLPGVNIRQVPPHRTQTCLITAVNAFSPQYVCTVLNFQQLCFKASSVPVLVCAKTN